MLETEVKKLTAAIEGLTAVFNQTETAHPEPTAPVDAPAHPEPLPEPVQPEPTVPVYTFDQVKDRLSAIIQKMGDGGAAVAALVGTFRTPAGGQATLLSTVDPDAYPSLLKQADELVK